MKQDRLICHPAQRTSIVILAGTPPVILAVVSGDPGLSLLLFHACGSAWNRTLDSRRLPGSPIKNVGDKRRG